MGFAVLYVLLFFINELISPLVGVVDNRISLLFLPAFVRVAAVVVAKLAGVLGLFIGAFVVGISYGDSTLVALGVACASAVGIFFAYWILSQAMRAASPPLNLPVLIALAALYSPLNAIIHAFAWEWLGISAGITATEITYMMIGDILGVATMFFMVRFGLRAAKLVFGASRA